MKHPLARPAVICCLGICIMAAAFPLFAADDASFLMLEVHGNFHSGGIVATVNGDDNRDATVTLEWRPQGQGAFRLGHPLTRIGENQNHFVGSLFWLKPGRIYVVRITLTDPDGVNGESALVANLETRPDVLIEPTLRHLHVSTSGSDSNSGTDPAFPLRTIQRAANLSLPGDLVLIQPGIYRESVTVPASGTPNQPIVFRGTGPGVIVDGADEAIAAGVLWTDEGNGQYSFQTGFATGHVVTEMGRLFRYASLPELQTLAARAPGGFYFDGTHLYVKFMDGSSPADHSIHVARYEDGFYLNNRSHIRIENLELRHFGAGSYGKGVYLRYSNNCVVRLCKIHGFQSAGIWLKGGGRHLIEDNEIWDTSIFSWKWEYSKGSSAENNAITFTNDIGRGNVVRRNTIHGTFNGIGPCGSAAPSVGITNETDIYDNILYQHTDDAIEPEGYCANIRLWNNYVQDVHMAFAVAPASPGPVYIVRNIAYRFGNTRTSLQDNYTASALKINSGYSEPIGPLYLYHNTFLTDVDRTSAIALLTPGNGTIIRARNNIIAGTLYALYKKNRLIDLDWDWNNLFTTSEEKFISWHDIDYSTLNEFQAVIGQELSGLSVEPGLSNPTGGEFAPTRRSPLVDRGVWIPGINDAYSGKGPDIGACEYVFMPGPSVPAILLDD